MASPSTVVVAALEQAGEGAAVDLLAGEAVDLLESIPLDLRAGDPTPVPAHGCPCGCAEADLLRRARSGDENATTELLHRYRSLARVKARSYFIVGAERDDLVQEGMIGVFKAIRDYQPDRGASFRTFAELCVTRQVVSAVRTATRLKHRPLTSAVPLEAPDAAEGTPLADMLLAVTASDPALAVISAEELRGLQRHFDEVLSDLETQVLRHHMEGKSYDEIAAMLQRHVKSVDNALQRIKRKLQDHLSQRRVADAG